MEVRSKLFITHVKYQNKRTKIKMKIRVAYKPPVFGNKIELVVPLQRDPNPILLFVGMYGYENSILLSDSHGKD